MNRPVHVVVFEDEGVSQLYPITIGRAAYAITCGGMRLLDWLKKLSTSLEGIPRPHLWEVQQHDFPELSGSRQPPQPVLLVNARLVPCQDVFTALEALSNAGQPARIRAGHSLAVAWLPASMELPAWAGRSTLDQFLQSEPFERLPEFDLSLPLFTYPHDVIHHNLKILPRNLEYRLAHDSGFREVADGLFVADGVQLGPHLVTDTKAGPILVEENASIGPFCYLRGPALLGKNSRVIEHAAIKDAVSIGPTVKVGGEVEASVIEGYSNKQHHGFLGHSYLGSWVNLGAGTCNSDLKNTYGDVKMEYRGEKVSSGMQFLGCIMGDYAKSAINTGIFTGKVIGACSMLYGFITTNVPSFVSFARLFGQVAELPPDVMIASQQRMFARRKVAQRDCDMRLIRDMFELTREERQQTSESMSF